MELLHNAKSVLGMDNPYNTMFYRDVPNDFKISTFLTVPNERELTKIMLPMLLETLELYYSDFEIVGQTLNDFKRNVQLAYNTNGETFERVLSVYDDDIAYPLLGRSETITYDLIDSDINERSTTENTTGNASTTETPNLETTITGDNSRSDIPNTDNSFTIPTEASKSLERTTSTGTNTTTGNNTENKITSDEENRTFTKKGTVITELSDLGVRPNYESLNGFIDNNRTAEMLFIDIFRKCFTLSRCYTW